jgi:hypothetical protein
MVDTFPKIFAEPRSREWFALANDATAHLLGPQEYETLSTLGDRFLRGSTAYVAPRVTLCGDEQSFEWKPAPDPLRPCKRCKDRDR